MAKMSQIGKIQQEATGVRVQLSPNVPVEPIEVMVASGATGACGGDGAKDIEAITVEDTPTARNFLSKNRSCLSSPSLRS